MQNQKDYLLTFLEVLRDICNRGISPNVSYDKREDMWTIYDQTAVQGQVVEACFLKVMFNPGNIRFEVGRVMRDTSRMIIKSGDIPTEGEKKIEHITAYLDDLKEYGVQEGT